MTVKEILNELSKIDGFSLNDLGMIRKDGCCPLSVLANQKTGTQLTTQYLMASRRLNLTDSDAWLIACAADIECEGKSDEGKAHNKLRNQLKKACRV